MSDLFGLANGFSPLPSDVNFDSFAQVIGGTSYYYNKIYDLLGNPSESKVNQFVTLMIAYEPSQPAVPGFIEFSIIKSNFLEKNNNVVYAVLAVTTLFITIVVCYVICCSCNLCKRVEET